MSNSHLFSDSTPERAPECPDDATTPAHETNEAAYYLETLKAHRRIAPEGESLGPDQTHRLERDDEGRIAVRRKRYSAI